jgi:hypothetical protein
MQFHEIVQSSSESKEARQISEERSETQAGQPEQVSITGLGARWGAIILLLVYAVGLGSGYLVWGRAPITPLVKADEAGTSSSAGNSKATVGPTSGEQVSVISQISMPDSYTLPVSLGDIGPQLLEAGAIDYDRSPRGVRHPSLLMRTTRTFC